MRRLSFGPLLVLLAAFPPPQSVAAQTGSQPNLVLTLFGGAVAGHTLWSIARQPLCVLATAPGGFACNPPAQYDTLRVSRDIGASLAVGISGTYFKSPHLGFQGEFYFLGLPFEDRCGDVAPYNADADRKNEQLCNDISGASLSTSAIAVFAAVIVRASPAHWLSPYVRGGAGLVAYSGGTVSLSGRFQQGSTVYSRAVILDDSPKSSTLSGELGAGVTAAFSPGYQLRVELRDAVVPLGRVTGPANDLAQAPTASKTYHHIALTLGLDIVLEKKRGRRY
ncbi:MAG: hypothetical protein AUH78_25865 [Gemmatimonadetes bacterium 13_1_40CM_4_69_8]|nr:MAG: hypothetical protein AUH46_03920 [Gemmatimonadetes bacterium 13_1_40CM_70_15]OLC68478.1 MAG: hypothetical protein AUH78_25865 [Gemmatimonadetes bacterium 13_1_40CM_4_69_8]